MISQDLKTLRDSLGEMCGIVPQECWKPLPDIRASLTQIIGSVEKMEDILGDSLGLLASAISNGGSHDQAS